MIDDFESYCSSETVKPGLPFVVPPPVDDVLRGFEELDVPADTQIPPSVDGPRTVYRDFSTLSLVSSSETTSSVGGLTESISNSAYSSSFLPSDFPSINDLILDGIMQSDSDYDYLDILRNFVCPGHGPSTSPDPCGLSLERDHVEEPVFRVKAQSDDGPHGPPAGISPLFTTFQIPPSKAAVPIDAPVDPTSPTKDFTGPIRTKPTCRQCRREFDRKSNLKAHEETHNQNRERPFVCPVLDCGYPFTRSHDLKRHLKNKHEGGKK